jgi:hypothetical protein
VTSSERLPRWDPDPRGIGVGDATSHLATIDALREAAAQPGWVAEEPEAHLLPHLRDAVAAAGASLAIDAARTDPDGTFVIDLHWVGAAAADRGTIRVAALALIAAVSETVTLIHEPQEASDVVVFEVVTGVLPGTSTFATHGHTLRLRVAGAPRTGR